MAVDGTLRIILFNATGDGRHRLHRFNREITHSGFIGQHHSVGAIQDRVGYITHFGPGWTWTGCHRIQHLCGRDDRNSQTVGFADQLLLKQRNLFGRHFHAEVAPRHHHAVTQWKNRVDLIDRLEFFDLGHHRGFVALLADQTTDLLHVGGIAHKTEGNPIHPLAETELQIDLVFLRQGPHR